MLTGTYQTDLASSQQLVEAEASVAAAANIPYMEVSKRLQYLRNAAPKLTWLATDGLHPGRGLPLLNAFLVYQTRQGALPKPGPLTVTAPIHESGSALAETLRQADAPLPLPNMPGEAHYASGALETFLNASRSPRSSQQFVRGGRLCRRSIPALGRYRNFMIREVLMTDKTAAQLVQEAKSNIENLTPDQVQAEIAAGNVTIVDIRDAPELVAGTIPGAVHASRGMLEFYADPTSPSHKVELNPEGRIILHCASGGRSALAVHTLRCLGYKNVAHLDGGFKAWQAAGKAGGVEHAATENATHAVLRKNRVAD